jgi:hypothetical protein
MEVFIGRVNDKGIKEEKISGLSEWDNDVHIEYGGGGHIIDYLKFAQIVVNKNLKNYSVQEEK